MSQPASGLTTGQGLVYVNETSTHGAGLPGLFLDESQVPAAATGVLAATEAHDSASFHGDAVAAGSITADLNAHETADHATWVATVGNRASLAAREAADSAAFAVTNHGLNTGTLAAMEAADSYGLHGLAGVAVGTLAAVETADHAVVIGSVTGIAGTLAASEVADHVVVTGSVFTPFPAQLAAVEAADHAALAGHLVPTAIGPLHATETADVCVIDIRVSVFQGWLAAAETADTAAFTTALEVAGQLAASEGPDRALFKFASATTGATASGPWYFAWADPTETVFQPTVHARWDEHVFSMDYTHEEGQAAHLELTIRNPRVPLLGTGRKSWAWFARDISGTPTPLGLFRLIGAPADMAAEKITIDLIALPLDLLAQKRAVAATLMVRPYWDPVFIEESRRLDPDAVLEGYSASWHLDPVTHQVTVSDWVDAEDGVVDFAATDAIYDSLKTAINQPPLKNVVCYQSVDWEQYAIGSFLIGYYTFNSDTAGGIAGSWPKTGSSAGAGWTVKHAQALDLSGPVFSGSWHVDWHAPPNQGTALVWDSDFEFSREVPIPHEFGDLMSYSYNLNTCWLGMPNYEVTVFTMAETMTSIYGDQLEGRGASLDYNLAQTWFFKYQVTAYLTMGYEARRAHNEMVRFTLYAGLQPLFTDPGGKAADFAQDSELLQLNGKVGQEGPYGPYLGDWQSGHAYRQNDVFTVAIGGFEYGYQAVRDHVALPFFDPEACATQYTSGQFLDAGTLVYSGGAYYTVLISGTWPAPTPNAAQTLDPWFQQPIYGPSPSAHSGSRVHQLVPNFRGTWRPGYPLVAGDITVAPDGFWYHVAVGHVTDAVFDRFADDVTGALLYNLMLNPPPIGNVAAATYYPTDRGRWSIEYGLMRARARIINRARTISISYDVRGDIAWTLSLRQGAQFTDARLPGGQAAGKITTIAIKADAKASASYRGTVTIKPVAGTDLPPPSASIGGADYVVDAYVDPAYTEHVDAAPVVAAGIQYTAPAAKVYDDGLFFPLSKGSAVISETIKTFVNPDTFAAGTLISTIEHPTTYAEQLALAAQRRVQAYQAYVSATQTWYVLTLRPVQAGPFGALWQLDTSPLALPNQITIAE